MTVSINGRYSHEYVNGVLVKETLSPANETVDRGHYAATTLSAVDGDLATANIKNGITLFGFAGSADVHDISDATAIEAEVITGETFYAVAGGIRTGTMPIVALAPGSNAYPAGYHAGNVGGLDAVDLDLVTANIKNGITIFNVAGSVDVRDVSDANALVGEVMNTRTFYAVGGARKTGTLATRTLNAANETVQAGYYAATTLSAVDGDLAVGNILSGVTIFGFAGVATVQDIADADAVLADVKAGKTFYSVTGGRKTGNLATVALNAAANAYPAGYHAGAASLTAVDADLATGNIKSGVTIFGVAGAATVQDIADADAVLADVRNGIFFYSVTGGRKTGNMATVALAAGSNAYPAGYHVGAANLTAVDGDLVTANIKNGITIFNIAGDVDVRDVSDADALVGEVKTGSTFYAVGGARKTGTGTQTLNPANEVVAAGYYAATTLSAVDVNLAAASILSGVNIFGFVGVATVQDIADADLTVAEAPTGKFFYAVTGGRKTGTGTKTLNPANETVDAGYYAATTLSAVDADLAVGNIADGVTIFGFLGTYSQALAEDNSGDAIGAHVGTSGGQGVIIALNVTEELTLATKTIAFDASSLAFAAGFCTIRSYDAGHRIRLYMAGVQVAETATLANISQTVVITGFRAMSGSQECKVTAYGQIAAGTFIYIAGAYLNNQETAEGIAVGSVKLV